MNDVELPQSCPAPPSAMSAKDAVCLFAFVESPGAADWHVPEAAMERQLMLHHTGSIAALVGIVPIADYCGIDAERRLADIAWLAPRIRRHAVLVEWAMRHSAVFPVPFGTLYVSLDSLTAFVHAHEATIAGFLGEVAGKEEWEVRAFAQLDAPGNLDRLAARAWPDWQELSPGKRYMRLSRDKAMLCELGRAEADLLIRDFAAEISPLAASVRRYDGNHRLDADGAELIARYAVLVPQSHVAALQERVRQAQSRAEFATITIVLSGPWPPFSFRPDLKPAHAADGANS